MTTYTINFTITGDDSSFEDETDKEAVNDTCETLEPHPTAIIFDDDHCHCYLQFTVEAETQFKAALIQNAISKKLRKTPLSKFYISSENPSEDGD